MDNSRGDLTDIIRSRALPSPSETADVLPAGGNGWQLLPDPAPACFPPPTDGGFADPFVDSSDPLFHELARTSFFDSSEVAAAAGDVQKMMLWEEARGPSGNLFSRMNQVSPGTGKVSGAVGPPPLLAAGGGGDEPVEISSPRLMAGIKRRKSQAKKVVCIPAPAVTSGKSSGEVVPSDLWAWRKYGQKPIKGSPYPRGYYRCSSSKGCSARKQVERSRTDPNMLVITYTSEHNHPWPTQRNALAGSTRTQPSKVNTSSSSTSKNSPRNRHKNFMTNVTEEPKECSSSSTLFAVKEEDAYGEMERAWVDSGDHVFDHAFDESFNMSSMMSESSQPDDFFADLAELDPDPMNIVFPKGFVGDKMDQERKNGSSNSSKNAMNPFDMFDWEERDAFGEERRGL
ncbi:putative WRKY transcription factor 35 [Platanthera zijinensis]|uniref:WRKY transcription factor 35 n=1 Tax=Platanthera zijinensis TaxID=2320716 RepID=A0AAP0G940_9ASPA